MSPTPYEAITMGGALLAALGTLLTVYSITATPLGTAGLVFGLVAGGAAGVVAYLKLCDLLEPRPTGDRL